MREAGGLEAILATHPDIQQVKGAILDKLPRMLDGKRFDAILNDPVSLNEVVKGLDKPLKHKLVALESPVQSNYQSPLISKNHPDKDQIIADFNRAYRELAKGSLDADLIKLYDFQANTQISREAINRSET